MVFNNIIYYIFLTMEKITSIPYSEVDFRFISNHYDIHINGTCIYNGKLCVFKCDIPTYNHETDEYNEIFVNIYRLSFLEKLKWRWKQFKFEQMVGYHWSYPHRKNGVIFRELYTCLT